MSKTFRAFLPILTAFLSILHFFNISSAQDIFATIKIDAKSPAMVRVEGRFSPELAAGGTGNFSMLRHTTGNDGLVKRISNMRFFDAAGKDLVFSMPIEGEYSAAAPIASWACQIDLSATGRMAAESHVSSLALDGGVLMLDDILPHDTLRRKESFSGRVKIEIPDDWRVYTTEKTLEQTLFDVSNIERSVIAVGRNWRKKDLNISGSTVRFLIAGDWTFSDDEAAALASEVFAHYQKLFGSAPGNLFQIILRKPDFNVPPGQWEAETRGTTVTITSSDMPFKSQSLQRLHEQLRHEIFHLWVPNGLNLSGRYDWFYEGFALYQSLKLGVAVNRIRFEDMLDTLSRAYSIDANSPHTAFNVAVRPPEIAATQVYARGILIAFLCDLALLEASRGKTSTDDLMRQIYVLHGPSPRQTDANQAIIAAMTKHKELQPIVASYVSGGQRIDWKSLLAAAGIEDTSPNGVTALQIVKKPSGRQKELLDKLGYNSWRKLSSGR